MWKAPWLPDKVPEGETPERCPRCGRRALIRWTLRRDRERRVFRLWVCTECHATEEREEPE
ncbi:MAG: hypothetical protein HYU24_10045 [Candidatus Rokubacteria bacterium]|nr:hypothetical protein [Candidatus Rokubacteria bacterium]